MSMSVLFEIYLREERDWCNRSIRCLSDAYNNSDRINKIIQNSKTNDNTKETSGLMLSGIADCWRELAERAEYIDDLVINNKSVMQHLLDTGHTLELRNSQLKAELDKVKNENDRIKNDSRLIQENIVSMLECMLQDKKQSEAGNGAINSNINRLLSLFESNVKSMALKESMRTVEFKNKDRNGSKSPRFIQEINNEELVQKYKDAGYVLSSDIVNHYSSITNITYNGLMERLKTLGVWQYKNKTRRTK